MALTITPLISGFTVTPNVNVYTDVTNVTFTTIVADALIDFNVVWLFGDGTYTASTETTVNHTYNKPGEYTVTMIVFNTIEEWRSYIQQESLSLSALPASQEYVLFTMPVTVTNKILDSISFAFTPVPAYQGRKQSTPFRIEFYSSQNTIPQIQLYSKNSLSQPSISVAPKWSHLRPRWRFVDIYNNELDVLTPAVSSVNSIVMTGAVSISAIPYDSTLASTTVVGVSGYTDFYYIDDMPGTVELHATMDTQQYSNTEDDAYNKIPSYSNSMVDAVYNCVTYDSFPNKLVITSNGIPSFTLDGTKWIKALTPYVITICDFDGYILFNYPVSNSNGNLRLITRGLTNVALSDVIFEDSRAVFQRYDSDNFDVGGYYTGFFQVLTAADNVQLQATVSLDTNFGSLLLNGISAPFNVMSYDDSFGLRKFNEDFDMAETIKSYALQETISRNTVLFDDFIGQIVGNADSAPEDLGKSIYERTANFTANHSDIDACNIDKLYSLCQQLNIPIEDYNFDYPANLKRLINIVSISYSRLKGSRELNNRNFVETTSLSSASNLGGKIDTSTYYLSAGTNIVIREKHTDSYELFNVVSLSGYNVYPIEYLSEFNFKTPLDVYYIFYEYVPKYTLTQEEGIIDWENPQTTLIEGVSSITEWQQDAGIMDTLLDYQLRRGLELISK